MEVKAVLCLFWIFVQRIYSLQESVESKQNVAADGEVDFERLENEYAVGNTSTEISSESAELFENMTIPEITAASTEKPQTKSDNITEFKPSWHLGEIEESRSANSNPFNKLAHLKFDNSLSVQPEAGHWHTAPPINNEGNDFNKNDVINNNNANLAHHAPNFFPSSIANENSYFPIRNTGDSFAGVPPSFQGQNVLPSGYQNPLQLPTSLQRPEFQAHLPDKPFFETTYVQEVQQPFNRPGSFHDETNFVTPFNDAANFEYARPPNFENYEASNGANGHSQIQEISPTRNQQFPYKFHHETPPFMDANVEYVADEQIFHNVLRQRRVSPWKKIIHLIGTILPFGLLLATLTPNLVQIPNSTQSTIPLSKLKDVNLPPEHKSLRMTDEPIICEEKNICEVILAGSKPRSNLLQNVLWNFVMRTPEKTAKDNGLRELFQAVKKRDCNLITC